LVTEFSTHVQSLIDLESVFSETVFKERREAENPPPV
jgi:hypothetical protein